METKRIKENSNNDLKYRSELDNHFDSTQSGNKMVGKDTYQVAGIDLASGKDKTEKLEYFTE